MVFQFLKYLQPIWYFNRRPDLDFAYFPTYDQLEKAGIAIAEDRNYQHPQARQRDHAWTAFQSGFIHRNSHDKNGLDVWQTIVFPIEDEYRFLRKNVHPVWVFYVFMLRLLSLKNPVKEWRAYRKTRRQKRVDYHKNPIVYPEFDTFESPLIAQNPLVSVIIPTLNRYSYLDDVLKDLEVQDYTNFEVIVVDQTEAFQPSFYENRKLNLIYWHQEEKALWKARNEAIKRASGDYMLLYDDDSRVDPDWITQHLRGLDFFDADLSGGVSLSVVGGEIPSNYRYFRWNDQLDTGNVLVKRTVFTAIGSFDRQFEKQRMGDAEFGMRAYLAGFRNISNPYAKRIHLKVGQGGLREMGSWDAFRTKRIWDPRPVPSVLYYYRTYFGNKAARYALLKNVPPALVPYQYKKSKPMKLLSALLAIVGFPLIVFQVARSWKAASKKLRQGAKIESL